MQYLNQSEYPKVLTIKIGDVAKHSGWIDDWNSFLWYIADHAVIKLAGDYMCRLEIVSQAHEYHVKTAISNFKYQPLIQLINDDLSHDITKKLSDGYRNRTLLINLLLSHPVWTNIINNKFTTNDCITKTVSDKLHIYNSMSTLEEKYPDSIDLRNIDNLHEKITEPEFPDNIIRPVISKGLLFLDDNVIVAFRVNETNNDHTSAKITKLYKAGESLLWNSTYTVTIDDTYTSYEIVYADTYNFRQYCANHNIPLPEDKGFSLREWESSSQYMSENPEECESDARWVRNFFWLMATINKIMPRNRNNDRVADTRQLSGTQITKLLQAGKSWGVRGHWRTYKATGKQVYVKAHTRGSGQYKKRIIHQTLISHSLA